MPEIELYSPDDLDRLQHQVQYATEGRHHDTLDHALRELTQAYAMLSTVVTDAPTTEVQRRVADIAADNIVLLRDWYPYLDNQYNAIRLACAAQLAHPDFPIAEWFYKGIEPVVMKYVARGDGAHTAFVGLLLNKWNSEHIITHDFARAFAQTAKKKRSIASDVLLRVVHDESQHRVLWDFAHVILPMIGRDPDEFESWVKYPVDKANIYTIAHNLKHLVKLYADNEQFLPICTDLLFMQHLGKFDLTTISDSVDEIQHNRRHDTMFGYVAAAKDLDLFVYEAQQCRREQHRSIDHGTLAFEFKDENEIQTAITETVTRANRQVILLLKGHSNKRQFSTVTTESLNAIFSSVRSSTDIDITVIMAACEVGKRSQVAFDMSKTGIRVIASNEQTYIRTIDLPMLKDGLYHPVVKYNDGQTVVYDNGHEIDRY